jgi:cytochrome c peroxidase
MHNGTFGTLAEVANFYDQGGGRDDPLAGALKPLGLSASEKSDLIAFLGSLSSATPVTVPPVDIPKEYGAIKEWVRGHN